MKSIKFGIKEIVNFNYCPVLWLLIKSGLTKETPARFNGTLIHVIHKELIDYVNNLRVYPKKITRGELTKELKALALRTLERNKWWKILSLHQQRFVREIVNYLVEDATSLYFNRTKVRVRVEVELESKKLPLKGILDRIEFYKDKVRLIELKTSSEIKPSYILQLAGQSILVEECFKKECTAGEIWLLPPNFKCPVELIRARKEFLNLLSRLQNLSEEEFFERTGNCESCLMRYYCPKRNGRIEILRKMIKKAVKEVFENG